MGMELGTKSYRIVSMMSGTSLDGVDLACCLFTAHSSTVGLPPSWSYRLEHAHTYPYTPALLHTINSMQQPATSFLEFKALELDYTRFLTQLIQRFIADNHITAVDYLSLHGHTVFHRPHQLLTVQITNLPYVAAATGFDVIGNFRELDVMRGGQGAPLAPFAEEIFEGDAFINFGGIANLGYKGHGYDINYCNLVLNRYAFLCEGRQYDEDGRIGQQGTVSS